MLAIVAPGQGAQRPGFLTAWLDSAQFADRLGHLSDVAHIDLVAHGTTSDAETMTGTAVAQPLLVAAALCTGAELLESELTAFCAADVVGGHSVGELAAAAAAGTISADDAMLLVAERGRAMADAAALRPTSMTAVVGGKPDEVLAAIAAAGCTPANNNGRGQIVAAGSIQELASLAANPPTRARLIPLSVAGAFHTEHMAPAVERLATLAATVATHVPCTRLLSNRDGASVTDGRDYLDRLVGQISNPVRWDLCMQTMTELGVTGLLELAPAGTLTGIAKRNMPGVELFSLNTPDQLEAGRDFVARHAEDKS